MNKRKVPIAGMHCRSCEMLVEDELKKIPEVQRCDVSHKNGTATLYYGSEEPNPDEIDRAVRAAGYTVGTKARALWISRDKSEYADLGWAFLFVVIVAMAAQNFGLVNYRLPGAENPSSLAAVFLVGLTAGLSTCLALVGGLILGLSARHAELHPDATALQKFRPHLFFNAGRVASYVFLGGVLGAAGSVLQLSSVTLGGVTIVVGLVMLVLGLKLTGIFPRLDSMGWTLPKGLARRLGIGHADREYSHSGAFMLGALTFFLPCGFTQAVQLYAISTGSFVQGALMLGVFALGTMPGLLGIGGVASVVKGMFARRFFKFAGIIVVALAFFNIANGLRLTGWMVGSLATPSSKAVSGPVEKQAAPKTVTEPEKNVQTVYMVEDRSGYRPNRIMVKKGVPVRWVIDAREPYSCASSIVVPSLRIQRHLSQGQNVVEFVPDKVGTIPFSCSMGMYSGAFVVVEDSSTSRQ